MSFMTAYLVAYPQRESVMENVYIVAIIAGAGVIVLLSVLHFGARISAQTRYGDKLTIEPKKFQSDDK